MGNKVNCKVCSSEKLSKLGEKYPVDLYRCDECGLVMFSTEPTEDILKSHYENYPVSGIVSPITKSRYEELLDLLEPFRKTGRILDIGCGEGFFLESAKKRGWDVHGTEFSSVYIPICKAKGISMEYGRLDISNYPEGSFDVITWFEVIEHINRPNEELEKFRHLVRVGGAVYLTTPNIDSLSRKILGPKWTAITFPDHLCYYSPTSIRFLFKRHGFSPLQVKTTGISIGRIKDSIRQDSGSRLQEFHEVDRKWQERFEKKGVMSLIKSSANTILNLTGKGDSLKALFKRVN